MYNMVTQTKGISLARSLWSLELTESTEKSFYSCLDINPFVFLCVLCGLCEILFFDVCSI